MNKTNLEHAIFAVLMQVGIGVMTGNWFAGGCFGLAFFIGREHAQHEYFVTSGGPVGGLNPLKGFEFWKWTKDAKMDVILPLIAVSAVYFAAPILEKQIGRF